MQDIDVYFQTKKIFTTFNKLFQYTCIKCKQNLGSLANLKAHLKEKHKLQYWLV